MKIFSQAVSSQCFLKLGMYGFEGSGKTFTMALLAIGLHRHIGSTKPVAMYDTETGSDYLIPMFKHAGIELVTVKARDLVTLNKAIKEAAQEVDILLVDSLTHPYREACSTYVKKKRDGTSFIRMQDWQPIKDAWHEKFSVPYVNSPLHILWASRAKNLFEDVVDDLASSQAGRTQFKSVQVGTAARSETESAYEPSILVEMTREMMGEGGKFSRRMTVIKERFNVIDGESFDFGRCSVEDAITNNLPFKAITPHVRLLNIGGEQVGFTEGTSEEVFDDPRQGTAQRRRKAVALEKIEAGLVSLFPSTSGKDKALKVAILDEVLGTTSWTEIKTLSAECLEAAVAVINALRKKHAENPIETESSLRDMIKEVQPATQ